MKKIYCILLIFSMVFCFYSCSSGEDTNKAASYEKEDDYSVDTSYEALELAKDFIERNLPPAHGSYDYGTGKTQMWTWYGNNPMRETSRGWRGTLTGSYQYITYGGTDTIEFSATVEIDNGSGTIAVTDYEFY